MAEEGAVIACHTVEAWNQQLQQANECKKLNYAAPSSGYIVWSPQLDNMVQVLAFKVVVDFTASWCGPCRAIAPFFQELAKKFTDVIFLKVDVDELTSVAKDWAIEAMPTFIFLKDGSIVDKLVGAQKDELPKKIELLMAK